MERPEILYRGVVLTFEQFMEYDFEKDLTPPNPPEIDEEGRKTVGDGNEYGVYMSTNVDMVRTAYAAPKGRASEVIGDNQLRVGVRRELVNFLPQVGVVYEIDTDGVEIRQPWISSAMEGHYNNGFMGEEWIADSISTENCKIKSIIVGSDFLHSQEEIKGFNSIEEMKVRVSGIFEARRGEIELVSNCLSTLSVGNLRNFSEERKLRNLFQDGEIQNLNFAEIDSSSNFGAIEYYLALAQKLGKNSLDISLEDIKKIASVPKEKLLEIKKYKFLVGGKEEHVYLAQFEEQMAVLDSSTGIQKDENVFVKSSRSILEGKVIGVLADKLKESMTKEQLASVISEYMESDEYAEEEGEELEEFALLYEAQKKFITLSLEERRVLLETVVSGLNQFQISDRDGVTEMYMQSPNGERVRGEAELLVDEKTLKQFSNLLPRSPKEKIQDKFQFIVSNAGREIVSKSHRERDSEQLSR